MIIELDSTNIIEFFKKKFLLYLFFFSYLKVNIYLHNIYIINYNIYFILIYSIPPLLFFF